ncbi:hypothetical protein C5C45_00525 [Rathayibacter rathayi]|uniref:NERD domain-containing protein n=1 Tax=Rathayibacter rathayi TaxID=33887 RepID=A0ABX5AIL5_RATRA|nr:hypothetical protein C5C34_05890 [Rathayibacter rathayi]PPF51582.1 hypothetical protein C5C08_01880 [Rathayibacter rathayi]PPF83173.1 hypothetical protein C5C14_01920 [Rathayibacter rathayi]PPG47003.1 hypothetical protein C5C20_01875 [Rathayibacter rathayi]PPG96609.1 hypothetical protein C5C22_02650 [Rathayibacter rathayi]
MGSVRPSRLCRCAVPSGRYGATTRTPRQPGGTAQRSPLAANRHAAGALAARVPAQGHRRTPPHRQHHRRRHQARQSRSGARRCRPDPTGETHGLQSALLTTPGPPKPPPQGTGHGRQHALRPSTKPAARRHHRVLHHQSRAHHRRRHRRCRRHRIHHLRGAIVTAPGQILGRAGASLTDASWAANARVAKVGQRGEERTARILNALALRPGGPTVIHDLRIPIPGFSANIDHVVISGVSVTILDTKVWAPGFYWTFGGVTRRGLELFAPADKRTIPAAVSALTRHLERDAPHARLGAPALIIWPSNDRTAQRLWFLRSLGARAVSGTAFERSVTRIVGSRPADPHVVAALVPLINS